MATTPSFPQNIILEDDFVLLRPLQESDIDNLLEISVNEPETWEYSLVRANGKENLAHYIQLALKAKENKTEFPFIVFDKKSGKYAGSTRFYDIQLPFKTLQLLMQPLKEFILSESSANSDMERELRKLDEIWKWLLDNNPDGTPRNTQSGDKP